MEELITKTQAYLDYVKEHYNYVQRAYALFKDKCPHMLCTRDLEWRAALDREVEEHDASKLSDAEFVAYRSQFFPTEWERNGLFSAMGKVHIKERFGDAWAHHQQHNAHHWQNWAHSHAMARQQQERHCIHMVLDWTAMAMQRGNPFSQYYRENKEKILIPEWAHTLVEEIFAGLEE